MQLCFSTAGQASSGTSVVQHCDSIRSSGGVIQARTFTAPLQGKGEKKSSSSNRYRLTARHAHANDGWHSLALKTAPAINRAHTEKGKPHVGTFRIVPRFVSACTVRNEASKRTCPSQAEHWERILILPAGLSIPRSGKFLKLLYPRAMIMPIASRRIQPYCSATPHPSEGGSSESCSETRRMRIRRFHVRSFPDDASFNGHSDYGPYTHLALSEVAGAMDKLPVVTLNEAAEQAQEPVGMQLSPSPKHVLRLAGQLTGLRDFSCPKTSAPDRSGAAWPTSQETKKPLAKKGFVSHWPVMSASGQVRLSGLEPETYGLKVRCSTD